MKVRYKEDPRTWLKSSLLSLLGLLIVSVLLRWRHVIKPVTFAGILAALTSLALVVYLRPRWFRGYYRFSAWAGFWSSQWVARLALVLLFGVFLVPAAFIFRLLGKDALQLRRMKEVDSYWRPVRPGGSLDRLF